MFTTSRGCNHAVHPRQTPGRKHRASVVLPLLRAYLEFPGHGLAHHLLLGSASLVQEARHASRADCRAPSVPCGGCGRVHCTSQGRGGFLAPGYPRVRPYRPMRRPAAAARAGLRTTRYSPLRLQGFQLRVWRFHGLSRTIVCPPANGCYG